MKAIETFSMIIYFVVCFLSCGNREQVRDNIYRGIYEGTNHDQAMKRANDPSLLPEERHPTYDQYKTERQKILQPHDKTDEQQGLRTGGIGLGVGPS